jgi:NAD(P)-dependent dehydrogenase (short-subunit alcohol dehydrogenase family)
MAKSVLIIGEDPHYIDFSAQEVPRDLSAEKIIAGLNGACDRLAAGGCDVRVLLTKDEETVEALVSGALKDTSYDVIVVGAGLRTLPPLKAQFERLINVLHEKAPAAKLAFNSRPEDSDAAALRWL